MEVLKEIFGRIMLKKLNFVLPFLLFFVLSGCGLFKNRNPVKADGPASPGPVQMVTKDQYDQLLNKYELLLREKNKEAVVPNESITEKDLEDLPETVDVFKQASVQAAAPIPVKEDTIVNLKDEEIINDSNMGSNEIEKGLNKYYQLESYLDQKKYDQAMILLKELESSPVAQLKVRAKLNIGNLLFEQKEYDLALQKYEEIIGQYSFSGLVLQALAKLVECSEKLGLQEKRKRYYSILHDFFES